MTVHDKTNSIVLLSDKQKELDNNFSLLPSPEQ